MSYGEIFDRAHVLQVPQPLTTLLCQLVAGPFYGSCSTGVEPIERQVHRAVLIMVPFDAGSIHRAHNIDARLWICTVPNEVSKKGIMSTPLLFRVCQNGLEGFKIRVDIG